MIDRKAALISGVLILLMTSAGLASWLSLPTEQPIAVHFGVDGMPDGWVSPARAFLFGPGIAALMWLFLILLRRMDPKRGEPSKAEARVIYAPVVLMAAMQGFFISRACGLAWPSPKLILGGIALMWMVLGNIMGKLRPNHAFGVRTPWALADRQNWDQTNRFGGRAMVLAGLGGLIVILTMPPGWPMMLTFMTLPMAAVLSSMLKSWLLWRRHHPGEGALPDKGSGLPLVVAAITIVAVVADLALEHGRSELPIALTCLAATLVVRYLHHRRERG